MNDWVEAHKLKEGTIIAYTHNLQGGLVPSRDCSSCIWAWVVGVFQPDPETWRPVYRKTGDTWILAGFPDGSTIVSVVKDKDLIATDETPRSNFFHSACLRLIEAARESFLGPPGTFKPPWEV